MDEPAGPAFAPSSARERAWLSVLGWTGLLGGAAILARRQLSDFDLPWNLATGRLVLRSWQIPRIDELAFTARPLRYVEVLGDTLLYALYALAGPAGLQVLCAGIGLSTVALLHARTPGLGPARWLWSALGLFALGDWFILRPVLFSWLGLLATASLLEAHRSAPDRPRGRWALAALVPLFFAWANTHGFVALGVGLAAAYAAYRGLARVLAGRSAALCAPADALEVPFSAGVVGLAGLAACANSMGARLLLGPLRADEQYQGITEWARPDLDYFVRLQPFLSLWFLLSLCLWASGRDRLTQRRLPNLFSAGEVLLGCALTASAVRMFPVGAILVAHAATSRIAAPLPARPLVAAACAACPLLAALGLGLTVSWWKPAGFDRGMLPVDAAEFVAGARPRGRMYNSMPYGGYLSLRLWPEHRVFTDGRGVLAREPELIAEIVRARSDPASFTALEQRFGFDWAVVTAREGQTSNPGLAQSPDWVMIYLDDVAAVYVRRSGPNASLSARGYQALRHSTPPSALLSSAALADPRVQRALAHDGALALAQAPESPRAAFLAAAGALAAQDGDAFAAAYQRLAWLAPAHPALPLLSERWQRRQSAAALP